jgi:pimeloyl-ACP methyl ester carboxylesterase
LPKLWASATGKPANQYIVNRSDSESERAEMGDTGSPIAPPPADGASGRPIVTRIGDHEIHALEFGAGERTILLLHGLSGSSRWWARNVADLSREFRVLVPDLIGFGRSRVVGRLPSIQEVADLLIGWLGTMEEDRISVVGHSMGGQISIHVVSRDPDRVERLVLVDSAGIPRALTPGAFVRFAAEVAPVWRWGDPTFLPVIAGDAWTAGPRVLLRTVRHILEDDVRPLLTSISVPTLIIWGERDSLVPLRDAWEFRRRIPDSRLAILRGAAHNSMVDRPADFNRLVRRFLNGELVGR